MNLFGHAVVAAWHSADPWHGLGAMWPDLVGLARARPPAPRSEPMRAGIALHHTTDAAFHASAPFVALCTGAMDELQRVGLSRGSARAAAHVGVELLLDGELAHDRDGLTLFRKALGLVAAGEHASFEWRGTHEAATLREIAVRLAAADIPGGYRSADGVTERLHWILGRRPRLAFDRRAIEGVRRWTARAQVQVRRAAPELLAALRPSATATAASAGPSPGAPPGMLGT